MNFHRGPVLDTEEVAQLAAVHMGKYGLTPSPQETRPLPKASMSSKKSNVSVPLAVQSDEEIQIKATLATHLINANRTIELLNAVVDAKDDKIAELATERGQNRKDLAWTSSQVSALAAELADVQSGLTLVTSKDSKVSRAST